MDTVQIYIKWQRANNTLNESSSTTHPLRETDWEDEEYVWSRKEILVCVTERQAARGRLHVFVSKYDQSYASGLSCQTLQHTINTSK